jgi:nicotinamide riboside transporter PnuC
MSMMVQIYFVWSAEVYKSFYWKKEKDSREKMNEKGGNFFYESLPCKL